LETYYKKKEKFQNYGVLKVKKIEMNNLFVLSLILMAGTGQVACKLLYPSSENIAIFKPLKLSPSGSICGQEIKDTLCDNRVADNSCNKSSTFYCDQTCPFGNVLEGLNSLEQIKLESLNPCTVMQDFNQLLVNNSNTQLFSYYFDRSNNVCNKNRASGASASSWRPFSLDSTLAKPALSFYNARTSSLSILNSGFTMSLWFKQSNFNNGYKLTG
jgi:hypothetical protein